MECWWVQPSSHNGSVHVHSRARLVSGTQVTATGWDFVDIQNELDRIVRNKAIYLKVATVLVTKKYPFFVKRRPFRFHARSVLHITVFIFAAWVKLF